MKVYNLLLFFVSLFLLTACQKEAGQGGTASIIGKVYVKEYYDTGWFKSEYYAPEERVYIVYGDGLFVDDDTRTHHDGSYKFDYLYPGKYTIYAYSDCDNCDAGKEPTIIEVEVTGKGEVIEAPLLTLKKID